MINSWAKLYGGSEKEEFESVCVEGDYIYAVGYTDSEGAGSIDTLIVKFNVADLTIAAKKIYGGDSGDRFYRVCVEGDYVYAVGYTHSEGEGLRDALIIKFNKTDLTIATRKIYGGSSDERFYGVYVEGDYVYAVGVARNEADYYDTLIVKFNVADLTIAVKKIYGGNANASFYGVYVEGNYIYAVGNSNCEGTIYYDALIIKFNIADLTVAAKKVYIGDSYDYFYGVWVDGDYVYAVGNTSSEGAGSYDALIIKFNKADLTIAARKIYGGDSSDYFKSVYVDGDYVYAMGYTRSEGAGSHDALIVKFNKTDLTIKARKIYGEDSGDYFWGGCIEGDYIYGVGYTHFAGAGDHDALIVKFLKSMPSGSFDSDPAGFTYQDSALTLADSALALTDSVITLADRALTLADSALTLADSNLTLSVTYTTGVAPGPPSDLLCNGETNPSDIVPEYFSAVCNEQSVASYYRIQVNKVSDFSGRMVWDSGKATLSTPVDPEERCENIDYNGQTLSLNRIMYYWRIKFWNAADEEGDFSSVSNFTLSSNSAPGSSGCAPWDQDALEPDLAALEPNGSASVEIPRRSGNWIPLNDVMRIHSSVNKIPLDALEVAQAEVLVSNISKNFNSAEAASAWYKQLEGYAIQLKMGYSVGGTPIERKLFTGITSMVKVDRLNLTAEIKVIDFLDYFSRITIEQSPVWQNISLTQLFKNLVELAFPEWQEGIDYFVEDLGNITVPVIGYEDINLLEELKHIANARGKRLFTDADGKLVCRSRGTEGDAWPISYDYNLISVVEKRDINSIFNWFIVHATPYELASVPSSVDDADDALEPDTTLPGKVANFTATPMGTQVSLTWDNPGDPDFDRVKIQFKTSNFPSNPEDGTMIYFGSGESKMHGGLAANVKYYYSAFTLDDIGNWSEAAQASCFTYVPGDPPEPPGVDDSPPSKVDFFTATSEHSKVILIWSNPSIANFSLVRIRYSTSSYPSSPSAGSALYEGTAETTVHSDLTNGQRYYYSIFVKNALDIWSGAKFASAIPGDVKSALQTATFWDANSVPYPVFGGCFEISPWTYQKNMCFQSFEGKFSEDWFRFSYEWDITLRWDAYYNSIELRFGGKLEDLPLNFNKTVKGVEMSVQKIKVEASKVQFWYKLHYAGSANYILFKNKLTLRG